MTKQIIVSSLVGITIISIVAFFYHSSTETFPSMNMEQVVPNDVHTKHMADGHMEMMEQMFVTSEQEFIEHMIPHHQEAIDTAREVLERGGTTEEMRDLMNTIITAQTTEIESMQAWYKTWFDKQYQDSGTYSPMMRELADLSGEDIDRAFLEDMIMHHMGAIMMARSIQPYIKHQEMSDLTQAIVTTQSAEISQMRKLLQGLQR